MAIEEDLITLTSSIAGGRCYWGRAPQAVTVKPYMIMHRISGGGDYKMSGATGFGDSRFQFDIYGETYTAALAEMRALEALISGYSGELGDTNFQGIFTEGVADLTTEDPGAVSQLHRLSIDALIAHAPRP